MTSLWRGTLKCSECGTTLNTAENVPEDKKGIVNVSSAFAAGPCPKGCRATFSDLNINTTLTWEPVEQPHDINRSG